MPSPAAICTNPSFSNPGGGDQSAINMPSIPVATDLQSTMAAVNALRIAFNNSQNGSPSNNNQSQPGSPQTPKNQPKNPNKQTSDFVEVGRVTKKVKVVNPDDDTQYVIVNQIVQLKLMNTITGETWVWQQGPTPINPSAP